MLDRLHHRDVGVRAADALRRFDVAYGHDGVPKLLEYNAETPTGLLEAAAVQWYWARDGAVGVAAQAVGFVMLDLLTPGKLNVICANEKLHPATLVSAAVQVSVALVVCASLT
ncbi:MAG: glutathionylspermidine synthase family protein [Actinomycetota bacterium]|nr:glutathionylspermidine synthase family protein [Actinomycetota bacterium]